jgi:hypothetical protein
LRTIRVPSASVGQSFSKKAKAWDVSSAGIMPSSLDNLWNAAISTENHQTVNEIAEDKRGTAKQSLWLVRKGSGRQDFDITTFLLTNLLSYLNMSPTEKYATEKIINKAAVFHYGR